MKTEQIIALVIFIMIVGLSVWYLVFKNSVNKIKMKIEEYVAVIDVALAVKQNFLMRLVEVVHIKEDDIPKMILSSPRPIWSHLERETYLIQIKEFEDFIAAHIKKTRRKIDNVVKDELLSKIEGTSERINNYIFIYNNNVATYNYKIATKQAFFFLKKDKYPHKELFKLTSNIENQ